MASENESSPTPNEPTGGGDPPEKVRLKMTTIYRIYELAYQQAVNNWAAESERADKTGSEIDKERAALRWQELHEIEELYRALPDGLQPIGQ